MDYRINVKNRFFRINGCNVLQDHTVARERTDSKFQMVTVIVLGSEGAKSIL